MPAIDMSSVFIVVGLFVILSPGFLLTLPALSPSEGLAKGISYTRDIYTDAAMDAAPTACSSGTAWVTADLNAGAIDTTHHGECRKAKSFFVSGYMSTVSALVHAVVFAAVLYFVPTYFGQPNPAPKTVVMLSALFLLLTPGLLLTLPALSRADCGAGGKNIASSAKFCGVNPNKYTGTPQTGSAIWSASDAFGSGDACDKCTSIWMSGHTGILPVFIHAAVFGSAAYIAAKNWM
jgi:hypothetical protein